MHCIIKSLTYEEYKFFSDDGWFSIAPKTVKKINIEYYRDSFLGDSDLHIELFIPKSETLDTIQFPGWSKIINNELFKNEIITPIDTNYNIYFYDIFSS